MEFWEKLLKHWPSLCNKGMLYEYVDCWKSVYVYEDLPNIWDLFGVRPSADMPSSSLPFSQKNVTLNRRLD